MKIPGSFFEVNLKQKQQLIELQVLKRGEVKYHATIMDFSEIEYDLKDVLEDYNIYLPKNRLDLVLQKLESEYLDLVSQIQSIQQKQKQNHRVTAQKLSIISDKKGKPHKILLTGGSGKTSIYKVIFEGILPYETRLLEPTVEIEEHLIDFPSFGFRNSQEKLSLWDTGQVELEEEHYEDASILIFVIDAFDIERYDEIRAQLHRTARDMKQYGILPPQMHPDYTNLFCFIHKIDLFPDATEKFQHLVDFFKFNPETNRKTKNIKFIPTTIFDSSVFTAWTKVIETLMPKSSKLNELSNQFKEEMGLYASFIIERRTGLPICASKTLLEDSALVGNINRLMLTIEKVLPDYQLVNLQNFQIGTATGSLEIRIFDRFFILMMLYPTNVDMRTPTAERLIKEFILKMQQSI